MASSGLADHAGILGTSTSQLFLIQPFFSISLVENAGISIYLPWVFPWQLCFQIYLPPMIFLLPL